MARSSPQAPHPAVDHEFLANVLLLQEFRVQGPPDQEFRLQEFLSQPLEVQIVPFHAPCCHVHVAHSFLVQEPLFVHPLPAQPLPLYVPPFQLVPASSACACAAELQVAPKMSCSPASSTPLFTRCAVPRESSSDPVPVDGAKVC